MTMTHYSHPASSNCRKVTALVEHLGGCHCGRVRFEVEAPPTLEVQRCNCSICAMTGYLHLIVPRSRFRLLTPWEELAEYRFNTGVARHLFCPTCGIKSFYVPRSHPTGISVNLRCLAPDTVERVLITDFDGRHWEAHAHELAGLADDGPPP